MGRAARPPTPPLSAASANNSSSGNGSSGGWSSPTSSTTSSSMGDSAHSFHEPIAAAAAAAASSPVVPAPSAVLQQQPSQQLPRTPPKPAAAARRPLLGTWGRKKQKQQLEQQQPWLPQPSLPLTEVYSSDGAHLRSFPLPEASLDRSSSSSSSSDWEAPVTPVSRHTQTSPLQIPLSSSEPSTSAAATPAAAEPAARKAGRGSDRSRRVVTVQEAGAATATKTSLGTYGSSVSSSNQRVSAATSPCSHPAAESVGEGAGVDKEPAAGTPAGRPRRSTRRRLLKVFLLTLLGIAGAAVAPGSVTQVPFPLLLVILLVGLVILLIGTAAINGQQPPQQQQQQKQDAAASHSSSSGADAKAPQQKLSRVGAAAAAVASCYDDIAGLLASVPRTARTLNWAVRAGLSYKRYLTLSDPFDATEYAKGLNALHDHWGERLTGLCRANGGVYVKAGQFLAGFGALPPEYRKHLVLLQDKARPRPFAAVDRVICCELGASAEQVFAEFHPEPTAAASLAQVHKARLASGEEVAVKIQYPGLERAAKADLTTLNMLSAAAALAFSEFTLKWLFEELQFKLEEELDFMVEVTNSSRLRALLTPERRVTLPALHPELCSSKLITMEWVAGTKVNDAPALRLLRVSPRAVGLELEAAFAEMTFLHGYIHADPHPGNIMVRTKGRRSLLHWLRRGSWQPFEIVLLDHGTYLDLPSAVRVQYAQLWCALFKGDRATAAAVAMQLGGQRAGQILPVVLTQKARTKEEQQEMQRAAGVSSMGDITNVLSTAPRNIVELLRIAAVIRSVTAALGTSLGDRARICGAYALRGVQAAVASNTPGGTLDDPSEADQAFAQWGYRMNVRAKVMMLQGYVAANAALLRLLLATLQVFGQDVVLM